MKILGIETSCDDTSAAVVEDGLRVLSNVVSSQTEFHRPYGGVVPEVASRHHLLLINPVIDEALERAGAGFEDIDAIAVTIGPGLIGALLIGLAAAKALSYALKVPLIGVNHLAAHIHGNFLESPDLELPLVALLVSGGHTLLAYMGADGVAKVLGQTLDDAAGEAFDKIARFLGLGYPGGPAIDELAAKGDASRVVLPRAMMDRSDYDFSLSGLKTAVLNYVSKLQKEGKEVPLNDLAAGFQAAIIDVQVDKTIRAAKEYGVENIVLAGGVAANKGLRAALNKAAIENDLVLYTPAMELCTDNAAMIAALGYELLKKGQTIDMSANAFANLPLA
ncbi:MAG: tRNA (adenosine(37)-N6)-threonylcarbamoyltransferase complex transferase subunit TsaD [Actinomycetota bacterium]